MRELPIAGELERRDSTNGLGLSTYRGESEFGRVTGVGHDKEDDDDLRRTISLSDGIGHMCSRWRISYSIILIKSRAAPT